MSPHGVSLRQLAKDERPASGTAVALRLVGYLRPSSGTVLAGVAWLIVSSVTVAASPALTGRLIDVAVASAGTGRWQPLTPLALALVAVTVLGWAAQRQQILALGTAGQQALYAMRRDVFARMQTLDVGYFESVESGDLMSRLVNDIEQVNAFLSQGLRRLLSSTLAIGATLAFMLAIEWRLALATLLAVPVMLATTRLFGAIARGAFRKRQEAIGAVSATLAEELDGIRVAQAFNRTERNRAEFAARNAANRDASIDAAAVASAFSPALSIIATSATALIAALAGWSAARGLVSVGVVVAFLNYARQFFNGVTQLSSLYSETLAALAGGERVFGLLDTEPQIRDAPDARPLATIEGAIRLDAVRFSYATGPEVLKGIDLEIPAGQTVALVGPTGAGKTTLASLIPRFYDPTSGTVSIDGVDLRRLPLQQVRAAFGIVLQEPFLFSGTIAANIAYGSPTASEDDVREAARVARVLEFADRLPDGLMTEVGERGSALSAGQRQLVAFARAIVGDPRILILDEATSSVDTRTERLLQDALADILAGRTAIIIAHRLSTIRAADRILVMQDGRIVEDGTYDELLAQGGVFATLHRAQFGD